MRIIQGTSLSVHAINVFNISVFLSQQDYYRYFVHVSRHLLYQQVFGTAMESSASTPVRLSFWKRLRFVAMKLFSIATFITELPIQFTVNIGW